MAMFAGMLMASRPHSDATVIEPATAAATDTPGQAPQPDSKTGATIAPPDVAPPSICRRLAALLYESVLLFGVVFLAGLAFSLVMQQRNGLTYHDLMAVWIAIVSGAYFVGFWHHGGQTLPMKTWRVRVVGPDDQPPSLTRATVRYLAAWLWFLPPLALHPLFDLSIPRTLLLEAVWFVLWTASARIAQGRQFPHDRIAGTCIVAAPRQPMKVQGSNP
jgi:uncharacterized RDD family membrane protein YckC